MDGIDISLVNTNGINLKRLNKNYFYKYTNKTRSFLLNILNEDLNLSRNKKLFLDEIITKEHFKALKYFEIIHKSDYIGFHGQTIYHDPKSKSSIQLGDPIKLSNLCKKEVVFDFRSKDIEMGGQGAPIAPIYHKHIIKELNLELPSCILNIGGVANLTYWDGVNLIGFDTGPGNALMDTYIKKISNNFFDENGVLASQGKPNKKMVRKFLKHSFFKTLPPKSLDRNSFLDFYDDLLSNDFTKADTMATLSKITLESIYKGISILPRKIKNILVSGGGCRNTFLMNALKKKLDITFIDEKKTDINFDYVESELIAFLSARSIYNLPFTFPSTTGAIQPSSGGKITRIYKKPC